VPFILAALTGVVVGFAVRGSFGRLASLRLRGWYLLILAIVLRVIAEAADLPVVFVAELVLLLAFATVNLRLPGLAVLGAGALLNLVVVAVNGGRMPIPLRLVRAIGGPQAAADLAAHRGIADYVLLDAGTRLPWLGDTLLMPWPVPRALSAGDILIMAGLVIAVAAGMRGRAPSNH
jgi:hypothetical protein